MRALARTIGTITLGVVVLIGLAVSLIIEALTKHSAPRRTWGPGATNPETENQSIPDQSTLATNPRTMAGWLWSNEVREPS